MNVIARQARQSAGVAAARNEILALARKHGVTYEPTALDALGREITRLSGDDGELDEAERLLLALRRAGHLTKSEATRLHMAYLRAQEE